MGTPAHAEGRSLPLPRPRPKGKQKEELLEPTRAAAPRFTALDKLPLATDGGTGKRKYPSVYAPPLHLVLLVSPVG